MTRSLLPPILGALLLAGCTGDLSDLQSYTEAVKRRSPAPLEPIPEFKEIVPFVYQGGNRRDPFVPDAETKPLPAASAGSGIAPDPSRPREPLERFPLDAIRMVGTLEQYSIRAALVKAPDGTLHRVSVGNHLGQNSGKIIAIKDNRIEVSEIVGDGTGNYRERAGAIALSD
jgi:type IV pilus assembly protein PilP